MSACTAVSDAAVAAGSSLLTVSFEALLARSVTTALAAVTVLKYLVNAVRSAVAAAAGETLSVVYCL